jgi:hypothetical protein
MKINSFESLWKLVQVSNCSTHNDIKAEGAIYKADYSCIEFVCDQCSPDYQIGKKNED